MKVLILSPHPLSLLDPMFRVIEEETRDDYVCDRGQYLLITKGHFDLIVLFGYRKILTSEETEGENIINMHISYLPWNRGACPNLFSWLDNTKKGVTIHRVVPAVDAGPILVQREIEFPSPGAETLRTTYEKLQTAMVQLFCDHWWSLRKGECPWMVPFESKEGEGSFHWKWECDELMKGLLAGYDTPVMDVQRLGEILR